jgi:putative ABC transport system permease protein
MTLFDTLKIALFDLSLHKFRSALATIGIIFGVASVEAMVSISQGAQSEALSHIAVLGIDNLIARSVKPSIADAPENNDNSRRYVLSYGLLRQDLEHCRKTFPGIRYAIGARNMRTQLYTESGRELDVSVVATEPDYLPFTRSRMSRGRFITPIDQAQYAQVAVLGMKAARKIFSYGDPLDQFVQIEGNSYRVVGLLENAADLKDSGGDDVSNQVFIPLATAQASVGDFSRQQSAGSFEATSIELDTIGLQLDNSADIPATAARLEHYLAETHKQKDFQLLVPLELLRQKEATQHIFAVVMASIAGISLLIGGIGIMNIMLANIFDRRKEIGTRRALGARRADILWQFLVEASALTTAGGVAGVGVGYLLAKAISHYAAWPTIISPVAIVLGLGISSLTGILFGLWPARQAARTNPIEALRAG